MENWFIIKTKPFKEDHVSSLFSQAAIRTLNPKIRERCYQKGVPAFRIKPLFPTYLFLNIDFDNAQNIHLVKYTRGVSRILSAEGKPVAVVPDIIATIQGNMNQVGLVGQQSRFQKGDPVRVKSGLLKDLIGLIERPTSANERICVLLNLVNYSMKATLHWTEVEKLRVA